MANTITHTMETWFSEVIDTTITTPMDYFEKKFLRRRTDKFRVQSSIARKFTTDAEFSALFDAIGQGYIDLIVNKKSILQMVPFSALDTEDRAMLREFICEQVQFAAYNHQVMELVDQSNMSTSGITINTSPTGWVFTTDMLSKRGTNIMQNSELDAYDIVSKKTLYTYTGNDNILVLREIDFEKDVPAIVWDTI